MLTQQFNPCWTRNEQFDPLSEAHITNNSIMPASSSSSLSSLGPLVSCDWSRLFDGVFDSDDEKDPSLRKGTFNGLTLLSFSELSGIRKFSLKELKLATLNFSFDNKLDYGGPLGVVYKVVLASGESVTVKRATRESQQSNQDFKNGTPTFLLISSIF